MIISSDVLPEPDGPTMATDWPARDFEIDVAQDLTGPARLVSVRRTSFITTIGLVTICSAFGAVGVTLVST